MTTDLSLPKTSQGLYDCIEDNWLQLLFGGAVTLMIFGFGYGFRQDPFYISGDSALFQHGGWYITQGAMPYVDFWDIKPPLIYAVTTSLALLSGGNMLVLHALSIFVASLTIAVGSTLVGVLNYRLTESGVASVAAGWSVFVIPTLYLYPFAGIRVKYMAFTFGTAALLLAVDDHPLASGSVGAITAGVWHLGAPIALLVVAIGYRKRGRSGLALTVAGGTLVTTLVLLPFLLTGNMTPLFVEIVLTPLYSVAEYTLPGRLIEIVLEVGYGAFISLWVSTVGTALAGRSGIGTGGSVSVAQCISSLSSWRWRARSISFSPSSFSRWAWAM